MSDNTELAKGFTVRDYRQAVKDQNTAAIADAIRRRFRERYLTPITGTTKHGFTMMGWPTRGAVREDRACVRIGLADARTREGSWQANHRDPMP